VRNDLDPPVRIQPNPYDVVQLVDYLDSRPSESTKLIWTLNLDLTPIYAVEAEPAYPEEVYGVLRQALRNGALPTDNEDYVARASIPGVLTNRTVQLFSGQIVPVVVAQARGLYVWKETALINEVIDALRPTHPNMDENYVRQLTRIFLDKVYYECRNLGASSPDRALNFAATNAYQIGSAIARGITSGQFVPGSEGELFALDSIDVTKSPYCRMDSDCWDVRIKFFSPENDHRAKSVYQFTIDVSDEMPVSLAPEHQFLTT
jgi:cyanobactin maturation PatA/PatG family protease